MSTPIAFWLADKLEDPESAHGYRLVANNAANELRRLHQSEREGWRYANELEQERKLLHEVNQMLLEAVKAALSDDQPYIEKCRAAIEKAGEA